MPVLAKDEIEETAKTAAAVWQEHYTPLLGEGQVAYMLSQFQSAEAISRQIESEQYAYFLLKADGKTAGYVGIQPADGHLFLSKLYVLKDFRGAGVSSFALEKVKEIARDSGFNRIQLTVNKGNSGSIAVYNHWGFETIDSVVTDIGGGYVMDDYVMELQIT